jgi:general secretion pathway protein D
MIIFLSISLYADSIELNLKDFARLVSSQHQVNIIVDDDIKSNKFSFFVQNNKSIILLQAFKRMLELKKLVLIYDKKNKFYYIRQPLKFKNNTYIIKLHSLLFHDIEPFLKSYKDLQYSYISTSNTIILVCNSVIYKSIEKVIHDSDYIPPQFKLKITVVEVDNSIVKERGVDISAYLKSSSNNVNAFVNLLTLPSTASPNVFDSSFGITSTLRFLNDIGVSKIESSPTVTVQSGKKVFFSSVRNIPYQVQTSSVKGASESKTDSISYKDIGLKVDLLPRVVEDTIFIDLKFIIESIINQSSTPTTSKRELNNNFQLKKGQLLVLGGLVLKQDSKSTYGVPILMKMPYLGRMFSFDVKNHSIKTLSILIEVL